MRATKKNIGQFFGKVRGRQNKKNECDEENKQKNIGWRNWFFSPEMDFFFFGGGGGCARWAEKTGVHGEEIFFS